MMILFLERYFIYGIGPLGVYLVLIQLLIILQFESSRHAGFETVVSNVAQSSLFIIGIVAAIFGGVVHFIRRRFILWADGLLQEDLKRYDDAWIEILGGAGNLSILTEIKTGVVRFGIERKRDFEAGARPRHYQDVDKLSISNGSLEPVFSLDQLLIQALGADPLLRELCQSWACRSNGCFLWSPGMNICSFFTLVH